MTCKINIERSSVKNPSNYDATSSGILVHVQSVKSLIRNYGCAETVFGWEKTWILMFQLKLPWIEVQVLESEKFNMDWKLFIKLNSSMLGNYA